MLRKGLHPMPVVIVPHPQALFMLGKRHRIVRKTFRDPRSRQIDLRRLQLRGEQNCLEQNFLQRRIGRMHLQSPHRARTLRPHRGLKAKLQCAARAEQGAQCEVIPRHVDQHDEEDGHTGADLAIRLVDHGTITPEHQQQHGNHFLVGETA